MTTTNLILVAGASVYLSTPVAALKAAAPTHAGFKVGGVPLTLARDGKSREEFWDAATNGEAMRLDAELETLTVSFSQHEQEVEDADGDFSLLVVQPEELGHFTPEYGAPIQLRILPSQEGRFSPIDIDDVDLEIFDL